MGYHAVPQLGIGEPRHGSNFWTTVFYGNLSNLVIKKNDKYKSAY